MRGAVAWPQRHGKAPERPVRRPHRHLEDDLQRAIISHLDLRLVSGATYWATPNGGQRNRITAALLKAAGAKPGIPDIFIVYQGRLYGLELKVGRNGLSPAQRACHQQLTAAGATIETATGIDAALDVLENKWHLLWGHIQ
jgi:hypothetical protein